MQSDIKRDLAVYSKPAIKMIRPLLLLLIFAIFSCIQCSQAQSLAFSQVMIFNSTTSVSVPAGKTWKIESENGSSYNVDAYNSRIGCNYTNRQDFKIVINGKDNFAAGTFWTSGNAYVPLQRERFPIWLPAGTTLSVDCADHQLYIIEFTVMP